MTEQDLSDFLQAFGEELCEALSPPVAFNMICPQDGYEVWLRAFGQAPNPTKLAALTGLQWEELRAACERYFECRGLSVEQVRQAVVKTLARWPADFA